MGFGRTSVWAGMPGTIIGGFGDTDDTGGGCCCCWGDWLVLVKRAGLVPTSLDGDNGAELSENVLETFVDYLIVDL